MSAVPNVSFPHDPHPMRFSPASARARFDAISSVPSVRTVSPNAGLGSIEKVYHESLYVLETLKGGKEVLLYAIRSTDSFHFSLSASQSRGQRRACKEVIQLRLKTCCVSMTGTEDPENEHCTDRHERPSRRKAIERLDTFAQAPGAASRSAWYSVMASR